MNINNITRSFVATIVVCLAFSCSSDDNSTPPAPALNIIEVANSNANLSTLVEALEQTNANLDTVLQGEGPFTVLAPTNAALEAFLAENNFNSLSEVPDAVLTKILLNHVIAANVSSADLTALGSGYSNTMAKEDNGYNLSLYFKTSGNSIRFNDNASVVSGNADIEASNGTIHIIDAVIEIPTIFTFIAADDTYNTLETALRRDDLPNFVGTLDEQFGGVAVPFTFFAPDNDAFTALLNNSSEWSSLNDIDTDTLTAVLEHHIIGTNNILLENLNQEGDTSLTTLLSDLITATLPSVNGDYLTLTDGSGNSTEVTSTGIQGNNGIIYTIQDVMLPSM